jgi:probable rRNA maturation factor
VIEISADEAGWLAALPEANTRARAAAKAALAGRVGDIAIRLTSDDAVRELNRRFRGVDAPTNVLAFPAAGGDPESSLGDIALAFGVCRHEAADQGKTLGDHLTHLTVHGVLHLLGYDHQDEAEAEAMESLERQVLAGLGVADPYQDRDDGVGG